MLDPVLDFNTVAVGHKDYHYHENYAYYTVIPCLFVV